MVKDATASYSDEEMHAALDINIPNYASAIVTTAEIVDSISLNRAVFPDYELTDHTGETPEALEVTRTRSHDSGPGPRRLLLERPQAA